MNIPNIPGLRKAVEWVEEQATLPDIDREWWQNNWWTAPFSKAHQMLMDKFDTTSRTARNELYRVRDVVEEHCGTGMCVAGYINHQHNPDYISGDTDTNDVHVREWAKNWLQITDADAEYLFAGENDAVRIREVAEDIAARAGERL